MYRKAYKLIWRIRVYLSLLIRMTPAAKKERQKDRLGISENDPGIEEAIDKGVAWLCQAQDNSASKDGGVANYSLFSGWSTSYPETTGYIVPTMLDYARLRKDDKTRQRAREMLDWLVSIQFPEGGFQCGLIGSKPAIPVTFNTGQILIGLASGVHEFGDRYRAAMCHAADWLVVTQDPDGCWRKHPSPLTGPGEKAYETHVAWGLLEAARIEPGKGYAEAALSNIQWALTQQNDNGWFRQCCTTDPTRPLTHALGYVLRGLLEAYRYNGDTGLLDGCRKTADGCLVAMGKDGFLPGRLLPNWEGAVSSSCLTGSVQIAYCLLLLYQFTKEPRYREAAYAINRYVRRTMEIKGSPETCGAIKGSFPVDGDYAPYKYPNWACKFFVDANILEKSVRESEENENNS